MPIDQGGMYLYRHLEQRLPGVLVSRRRELPYEAGVVVPTMADLQVGAYEVVKQIYESVGNAKVLADGAYDVPIVDMNGNEDRFRVLMVAAAFNITFSNERRAQAAARNGMLQVSEYDEKLKVASRAIMERRNALAAYGNTALNVTGFLNNANVTPDITTFDPYAATTTASDLSDFLIAKIRALHINSNNVFLPTAAVVSPELRFRMLSLRVPYSAKTVWQDVQDILTEDGIPFRLIATPEVNKSNLEANGVKSPGANKERIVLYPLDPEVVERHVEVIQLAPPKYIESKNLNTVYPLFGCTSPAIINYPAAVAYIDHNSVS